MMQYSTGEYREIYHDYFFGLIHTLQLLLSGNIPMLAFTAAVTITLRDLASLLCL